jgi:hypothetical protein
MVHRDRLESGGEVVGGALTNSAALSAAHPVIVPERAISPQVHLEVPERSSARKLMASLGALTSAGLPHSRVRLSSKGNTCLEFARSTVAASHS